MMMFTPVFCESVTCLLGNLGHAHTHAVSSIPPCQFCFSVLWERYIPLVYRSRSAKTNNNRPNASHVCSGYMEVIFVVVCECV